MRVPSIVGAIGAIVLAAALGCGPKPATTLPTASPGDACLSFWFTPLSDTITVALFEPVDPAHAPWPRNYAERLVFNHLYATPFKACVLSAEPSLMDGQPHKYNDRIVLVLRETARFWDGSSVSVNDVVESLRRGFTPSATLDSVAAIDRRSIEVFISRADPWGSSLISPFCAVTKDASSPWPMGCGPYSLVAEATSGGVIMIRPALSTDGPVIRFVDCSRSGDARDVLDSPMASVFDLMITNDRNTIEYAETQAGFRVEHLTSNRAYLLLSVTRAAALANGSDLPLLPASTCANLATDAVSSAVARGESGGANIRGYWWTDISGCRLPSRSPPPTLVGNQSGILFDQTDQTAKELAERIVALGSGSSPDAIAMREAMPGLVEARPVASGVGPHELSASMARGDAFAYVVAVSFRTTDPCREAGNLLRAAPWLASSRAPLAEVVLPLVSTRPFALVRNRGNQKDWPKFGVNEDHYGNLTIVRMKYDQPYQP